MASITAVKYGMAISSLPPYSPPTSASAGLSFNILYFSELQRRSGGFCAVGILLRELEEKEQNMFVGILVFMRFFCIIGWYLGRAL
jgi:hypothetical protein